VIARLDAAWSDSAVKRDAGLLASFYAEDAVVYPSNDPLVKGRAAARKYWGDFFASDPSVQVSWKTERAEVSASGELGYAGGSYKLVYKGADGKTVEDHGKTLSIWRREKDGSWKAIQDMWNSDTK
jgi:ketosteroid isomerase-like protein